MPCWYFEKVELSKTPSVSDGLNTITEAKYRREGVKLIIDAGAALGIRYVTATACLFLAAKLEENSVTWDSLVETIQSQLTQPQFTVFGEDPKEEVLATEKILLETLKFDLVVQLPYSQLLKYIKILKGDSDVLEQLLKMSWTFINDSLCTTLCVQWEPELIALSLLYLSCHLIKFNITDWVGKPANYSGKWYQYLVNDINLGIIDNICRQVLGLYTSHQTEQDEQTVETRLKSPDTVSQRVLKSTDLTPKSMSISPSPPPVLYTRPMNVEMCARNSKSVQQSANSKSRRRSRPSSSPDSVRKQNRSLSRSPSLRRNKRRAESPIRNPRRQTPSPDQHLRRSTHTHDGASLRRSRTPEESQSSRRSRSLRRNSSPRQSPPRRSRSPRRSQNRTRSRSQSRDKTATDFEARKRYYMSLLRSGEMLTINQFHVVQDVLQTSSGKTYTQEQFELMRQKLIDDCSRDTRSASPQKPENPKSSSPPKTPPKRDNSPVKAYSPSTPTHDERDQPYVPQPPPLPASYAYPQYPMQYAAPGSAAYYHQPTAAYGVPSSYVNPPMPQQQFLITSPQHYPHSHHQYLPFHQPPPASTVNLRLLPPPLLSISGRLPAPPASVPTFVNSTVPPSVQNINYYLTTPPPSYLAVQPGMAAPPSPLVTQQVMAQPSGHDWVPLRSYHGVGGAP